MSSFTRTENTEGYDQILKHALEVVPTLSTTCKAIVADFSLSISASLKKNLPQSLKVACGLHYDQ